MDGALQNYIFPSAKAVPINVIIQPEQIYGILSIVSVLQCRLSEHFFKLKLSIGRYMELFR